MKLSPHWILWSAALLPGSVVMAGLYESNLLANPGFEDYYTGASADWTGGGSAQFDLQTDNSTARGAQAWINAGNDNCSIRSDGPASGHAGDYYGTGGHSTLPVGHRSRMRQDIDLLACGFTTPELDGERLAAHAGAWLSSFAGDDDSIEIQLYFLGADLAAGALAWTTGPQAHDGWTLHQSSRLPIPTGTRFIRYQIEFVKQAGNNSDGRVDDAWVNVSPINEPSEPLLDRNLIANPGFEAGAKGWQAIVGNPRTRVANLDGVPARSGQYLLFGGQRPMSPTLNQAMMVQEVTFPLYGITDGELIEAHKPLFLQFGCWLYSFGNVGQIRVRLELQDTAGTALLTYDTLRINSDKRPAPFHWQDRIPAGAYKAVVSVEMLDPGGTNLDGYIDDVSLVVSAIPHRPRIDGPLVIAHRGNSIAAPENTLASLTAARGLAALGELDTYVCESGEVVLMHDSTVNRTTDGSGAVAGLTLAELKRLDAGAWFSSDYAGEPVPTLTEAVMAMLPEVVPLIERKAGSAAAHLAVLRELGVENDVVIQAFDWNFLAELHNLAPDLSLGALHSGALTAARVDQAQALGAWFIALDAGNVNPQSVAMTHAAGLQIWVWTVDHPTAMQEFIDMGVDGIITNNPTAARWLTNPSIVPADLDGNGHVDHTDLALFRQCQTAAGLPASPDLCGTADLDGDLDVDQSDFGLLQRCFSGPEAKPLPGCAEAGSGS